jgi:hypothetical protein
MKKHTEPASYVSLLARTIPGAEWIEAAVIDRRLGSNVTMPSHREDRRCAAPGLELLELGRVDDLFLTCALAREFNHVRASLGRLAGRASDIDFQRLRHTLRRVREVPRRPRFDVVACFLCRRNYNRFEIEDSLGAAFASETGCRYLSRTHGDKPVTELTFRVHLSGDEAFVGLRLADSFGEERARLARRASLAVTHSGQPVRQLAAHPRAGARRRTRRDAVRHRREFGAGLTKYWGLRPGDTISRTTL